jgi:5-methyltetrahydrofolate--homocysteine methyltransferase
VQDLTPLKDAILTGNAKAARSITEQALAESVNPLDLVQKHMVPAMDEVGRRFERGEYFLPELMLAGRAMKAGLDLVRPLLAGNRAHEAGRVVIGTVQGDLHDIGKNIVSSMLEGAGYQVTDLGVNVAPQQFIAAITQTQAQIVAMSALLTTTMPAMKSTIEALAQAGVRGRVKVLVGGAPISQRYAEEIGADGFSESAVGAVALARKMTALEQ